SALGDVATLVAPVDPAAQSAVAGVKPAPAHPAATTEALGRAFDVRRSELTALLQAIDQRGDADAKRIAADLSKRLKALAPAPASATTTPADDNALIDRLRALDDAVHVIEDGLGATAAADLRRALDLAREQIAPGTGMAAFSARQAELTRLLDALQSQA